MRFENLSKQLEKAPLTGVLASVKSATRSRVTASKDERLRLNGVEKTDIRGTAWAEIALGHDQFRVVVDGARRPAFSPVSRRGSQVLGGTIRQ